MFSQCSNHEEKNHQALIPQIESLNTHLNDINLTLQEEFQQKDFLKKLMVLGAGAFMFDSFTDNHYAKLFCVMMLLAYGLYKNMAVQDKKIDPPQNQQISPTLFKSSVEENIRKKYNIPRRVNSEKPVSKTKLLQSARDFQERAATLRSSRF